MENAAPRLHPLLIIAAVSVTAVSLAGVGVLTGIIPGPHAESTVQAPVAATSPATPQATPQPAQAAGAPSAAPVAAAEAPKPEVHRAARKALKALADKQEPRPRIARHEAPLQAPAPLAAEMPPPPKAAPTVCHECGVVEAVNAVTQEGKGTGLGAVAGGLAGAVIGNQISHSNLARIAGGVGGGLLGNEIEKSARKTTRYDIVVRMDDGTTRTVSADQEPAWKAGDRVKVNDGVLISGS